MPSTEQIMEPKLASRCVCGWQRLPDWLTKCASHRSRSTSSMAAWAAADCQLATAARKRSASLRLFLLRPPAASHWCSTARLEQPVGKHPDNLKYFGVRNTKAKRAPAYFLLGSRTVCYDGLGWLKTWKKDGSHTAESPRTVFSCQTPTGNTVFFYIQMVNYSPKKAPKLRTRNPVTIGPRQIRTVSIEFHRVLSIKYHQFC